MEAFLVGSAVLKLNGATELTLDGSFAELTEVRDDEKRLGDSALVLTFAARNNNQFLKGLSYETSV